MSCQIIGASEQTGTRERRILELTETMEKDERMHAERTRAHETRMNEHGMEKLMLVLLVEGDARERRA